MLKLAKIIGTSFGFGYAPVAPGTFGTFFGVLIYLAIQFTFPEKMNPLLLVLIVVGTIVGTWCCKITEPEWGHDSGKIVLDESVGLWITLLFVPFKWWIVLAAFVLFRFYDILKPLGIKRIDEGMHSPASVMLDDVLAGFYAWLTLQAILWIQQSYF